MHISAVERAGLPVGPILSIAQMLEHPQTIAREMVVETEHARAGHVKSLGLPIKFSDTPGAITRPAPLLGEHSYEVLLETGYTSFEIDKLIEDGVVVTT